MSEQMVLFFKVVVIGGVALGMVSLGLGLYYEFFERRGRRIPVQHTRERERLERRS
jgi:hypothetical protein